MSVLARDILAVDEGFRRPTLGEAIVPVAALLGLIGVGYGWLGFPMEAVLLSAAAVAGGVGRRLGYAWVQMERGIVESFSDAMPAILTLISVGALIGTWNAAGTIPMLIFYGLDVISPRFFLVSACVLCSIVSVCTGTSWGTVGTVGVALMGMATALGVPAGAAAGAIVAGSYFGDKMSPFSDQTVLAPAIAGANLFDHIRWLVWTTGPAWMLGVVIYSALGVLSEPAAVRDLSAAQQVLSESFRFDLALLLPPLVTLGFICAKLPAVPGILLSSVLAIGLAVLYQNQSPTDATYTAIQGYRSETGNAPVDALLTGGGMASMMDVTLLLVSAFAFAGIMIRCGFLGRLLDALLGGVRSSFHLVGMSVLTGIATALVTGSSHLSIIVPGQLLGPAYKAHGLAAKNLSRTTEDSGSVVVPLIPWSAAGVFVATTLDVPTLEYLPWAIMNYTGFLFALFYGATGIRVAPRIRENETLPGS